MKNLLLWVSGFLVAIGLMVFDEVLTLARYCGPDCLYEIPYLGGLTQYGAEIFGWLLIIGGFALSIGTSMHLDRRISKDSLIVRSYLDSLGENEKP